MAKKYAQITNLDTARVLTANGNSAAGTLIDDNKADYISVILLASAVGGTTPSLAVEIQWSNDGVTFSSAETPDTFTAITANKNVAKTFQARGKFFRLAYTVTGTTPTFTLTASVLLN